MVVERGTGLNIPIADAAPFTLVWNRHHLRHVLTRYLEHYNTGRPHRGINLDVPVMPPMATVTLLPFAGGVERVDILGGLIHEYERGA